MKTKKLNLIIKNALIASLYVVLTLVTYPVSYGNLGIEFRLSEIMILICFLDKRYVVGLTTGCFVANLFGTMGIIDAVIGSFATLLSCICIIKVKNIFIASFFPVIFNALIIGAELYFIYEIPFFIAALGVAIGELVIVSIIGCPVFIYLKSNKSFMDFLSIENKKEL